MNELNSIETRSNLDTIPLSDQTKFRLNEINKIKDYFSSEIQERKTVSKILSKYIAAFDYIGKTFIVLSATSGGISFISFSSVVKMSAGIASATFILISCLTTGIIKKLLKETKKKKKKHNKIVMLAKSKLNRMKTLMSQALIDLDISHEEFKTIVHEEERYEQMKENISRDELSENSRDIRKKVEMYRSFSKNIILFCMCKMVEITKET